MCGITVLTLKQMWLMYLFAACETSWTVKALKKSSRRCAAQDMFLKLLRRIPRTFRFRLTVSFSLSFIALSILLFGFAYFLVSSSLQTNDRIAIELKLKEYSNEHQLGSITNLKRKIEADFDSGALKLFMVRLADAQNKTLL